MAFSSFLFVCIGGWLVLRYGAPVFFPIFIGWLASDGVRRIAARISSHLALPRRICAIVLSLLALSAAVGSLCAVVLLLRNGGKSVWSMLQTMRCVLPEMWKKWMDMPLFSVMDAWAAQLVREAASFLANGAAAFAGRTLDAAENGMAQLLLTVGVFLFRSAAIDSPPLRHTLLCRLTEPMRGMADAGFCHLERMVDAAWLYLRAAVGLSGCAFAVFAAIFTVCRIRNGLFLAALAALADLLPIVGAGIVLLPWAIVQFLIGETAAAWTLLAALAIQWLLRQFLEPKWCGKLLRLPPCLTLITASLGYTAAGIPGMLLLPLALAAAYLQ